MVSLKVNGTTHTVDVDDDTPLLWAIRDNIGLTGTKFGCGVAQCGACTVFIDGQPLRSCVTPVSAVDGRECHRLAMAQISLSIFRSLSRSIWP